MTQTKLQPLALLTILAACFGAGRMLPAVETPRGGEQDYARDLSSAFQAVSDEAGQAVVSVTAFAQNTRRGGGSYRFQVAQGSGVIVRSNGVVLTNNHVVARAEQVEISLQDGRVLPARILGRDAETDLAVLRADVEGLPFLALEEAEPRIGEWVLAVGNPFGLGYTVTAGIVSGTGRADLNIATYEDFLQTDAAINPGNSGGPLLNLDGRIIGINTAKGTPQDGTVGIGFAIPVHIIEDVLEALLEKGRVVRGYLGVELAELSQRDRGKPALRGRGVRVQEVVADSPAAVAGLRPGDVIVAIEGQDVSRSQELMVQIARQRPETAVGLSVIRSGKPVHVSVRLAERTVAATQR